jgi:hypothetical protein
MTSLSVVGEISFEHIQINIASPFRNYCIIISVVLKFHHPTTEYDHESCTGSGASQQAVSDDSEDAKDDDARGGRGKARRNPPEDYPT